MNPEDDFDEFPACFRCPISLEVMVDPHVDPEGQSYELSEIEKWLLTKKISPTTRSPLTRGQLSPNRALKEAIQVFRERSIKIGQLRKLKLQQEIDSARPCYELKKLQRELESTDYWWATLLFVNSLVPYSQNFPSWILSNDVQFFVLLAAAALGQRGGAWSGASLFVSLVIVLGVAASQYPVSPDMLAYAPSGATDTGYWDLFYARPWFRWPAAAIGALTFLLHARLRHRLQSPRARGHGGRETPVAESWCLSLVAALVSPAWSACVRGCCLAVIAFLLSFNGTTDSPLYYTALSKPAFTLALALLFLGSLQPAAAGGGLQRFAGAAVWQVLAKLTFGVYLVHLGINSAFACAASRTSTLSMSLVLATIGGVCIAPILALALFFTGNREDSRPRL